MSGHSKWSTIKRKKGAADARRGAAFTQVSKDITLAAREGGGDHEMNPALRLAIKKAKAVNMPSANIERAINKGIGNLPGMKYENYIYEGYGPGGVAIMMEVMTDNKNRTVPDIRHIMSKNGGNLGESGCVNWMFEKKGTITLNKRSVDEDVVLEKSLELGADDFGSDNDVIEITTSPELFGDVSDGLEKEGYEIEGEVGLSPINSVNVSGADAKQLLQLLEKLEENEDIQKVYSNFDLDESELGSLL
ncbi:MAG: YebC/PmpR family DNA-binding transcriptional regulator [Candidatus Marinimicrobia bacterium]|jgi:YebC/PmpR family DNA-binding regulatory protein|nr:YebC/PmpR family DNA-binding transcriptional regulator [Candidatus Neomarinimicrobiota bacterium]MDP7465079.1 YebC/PmpR family DNA-binding transcriptional regulator [Candidatus Neomarinimicrobiota bacterium]